MRLMKLLFLFLFFLGFTYASNQSVAAFDDSIYVSGNITSNQVWDRYTTVFVTDDVTVDDGVTLRIEDGVPVYFMGHYAINVQGTLRAIGTSESPVIFTRQDTSGFSGDDTTGGWHGIRIDGTNSTNDSSIFEYCTIQFGKAFLSDDNWQNMGGGMFIRDFDKVRIEDCTIEYNKSSSYGAGLRIHSADIKIINSKIMNNTSSNNGGGFYVYESDNMQLIGCLISNNYARNGGGLITNHSDFDVTNCTFADNSATYDGHAFRADGTSANMTFTNCIFWADTDYQIYLSSDSNDPNFRYCNIKGDSSAFEGGGAGANYTGTYENNINSDPYFTVNGIYPYTLESNSPCINEGTPDTSGYSIPKMDIAGNDRIYEGQIDMGCYESQVPAAINENSPVANTFEIYQNYPNPFNPVTTIKYSLPYNAQVTIVLYNALGQKLETLVQSVQTAGIHSFQFDGSNYSSGIYYYHIYLDNGMRQARKMVLLK